MPVFPPISRALRSIFGRENGSTGRSAPAEESASLQDASGQDVTLGASTLGKAPSANGDAKSVNAKNVRPGDASPFLRARGEVNSKLRALHKQKHQWMVAALVLSLALAVAAAGLVYASITAGGHERFLVAVGEESGEVLRASLAGEQESLSKAAVENKIEEVVRGLRTVYVDRRATAESYSEAYHYVAEESKAAAFISDFVGGAGGGSPVESVGEIQRAVTELRVTPIAGTRSWSVSWTERTIGKNGGTSTTSYEGSVSVLQRPSSNLDELRKNPTGIYLDGATWSEVENLPARRRNRARRGGAAGAGNGDTLRSAPAPAASPNASPSRDSSLKPPRP